MQFSLYATYSAVCTFQIILPLFHLFIRHFPSGHVIVRVLFMNVAVFCLKSDGVLRSVLSWIPCVFNVFCMADSRTEMLTSSSEFFTSLAVTLWFFFTSLHIPCCPYGVMALTIESSHCTKLSLFTDNMSNFELMTIEGPF